MKTRFLAVIGALSAIFLFVILQTTTPSSIHPVGLLGVFILLYSTFGIVILLALYFGAKIVGRMRAGLSSSRAVANELTLQRAYIYATILALAPVVLIGMKSVGNLGLIDIALVLLFELIACFYIWKRQ